LFEDATPLCVDIKSSWKIGSFDIKGVSRSCYVVVVFCRLARV
jgi:hypothetical protein